jgi:hypothetical protein
MLRISLIVGISAAALFGCSKDPASNDGTAAQSAKRHVIELSSQGLVTLDGAPAGTTQFAAEANRFQKIEELSSKVKPLGKQDTILRLQSAPEVRGVAFMSAMVSAASEGFSSFEVVVGPNATIHVLIDGEAGVQARGGVQPNEPHGMLAPSRHGGLMILSWPGDGDEKPPSELKSPVEGESRWTAQDVLTVSWKDHPKARRLFIAPDKAIRFSEFGTLLSGVEAARKAAAPDARIVLTLPKG